MSGQSSRTYVLRPAAGASATAPDAGLSKSHIRPQATVRFYAGGSLVRFEHHQPSELRIVPGECPKRAEITEFSEKSRQRLRLSLAKVDYSKAGRPIFGTLTYPAEFPLDEQTFKRHLKIFSQRFLRAFPDAGFHWKLEFQDRGAPHFHPIFWNLSTDREFLKHFRRWVAWTWFELVGSGDEKHLRAGTAADVIKSPFGIMRYVSPYVSNSDQSKPGFRVGRYWGIAGRSNIPWAKETVIELSSEEGKFVRRVARRYMQAMNRKRRIRYLERSLPKSISTEMLLNGEVRKLRKQAPRLQMFEHFPRKLRLKNNRNVNVFCDAAFWKDALTRKVARLGRSTAA